MASKSATQERTFAAVRVQKIASIATIRAAEKHARRTDEASARRVDPSRTSLNLAASQYASDDPLSLEAAFRAFKKKTGAVEGKGAAIMAHMIVVISPEVLAETGDPRDPNNPRVRKLFEEAQAWAEDQFGKESLIAARLDVDEAGAGVVDLYLTPIAMQSGGRGRKPKLTISVKSALQSIAAHEKELRGLTTAPRSYSALQDSWGRWAASRIDPRLKRGKSKRQTMREHVHAEIIAPSLQLRTDNEARTATLEGRGSRLDEREAALTDREARLAERAAMEAEFLAAQAEGEIALLPPPDGPTRLRWQFRPDPPISPERRERLKTCASAVSLPVRQNLNRTIQEQFDLVRAKNDLAEIRRSAEIEAAKAKAALEDAVKVRDSQREHSLALRVGLNGYLEGLISRVAEDARGEPVVRLNEEKPADKRLSLWDHIKRFVADVVRLLLPIQTLLDGLGVQLERRREAALEAGYDPGDDWKLANGPGW